MISNLLLNKDTKFDKHTTYLGQPFAGFGHIEMLAGLRELPHDVRETSHELPGLVLGHGQSTGSHRQLLRCEGRQVSMQTNHKTINTCSAENGAYGQLD